MELQQGVAAAKARHTLQQPEDFRFWSTAPQGLRLVKNLGSRDTSDAHSHTVSFQVSPCAGGFEGVSSMAERSKGRSVVTPGVKAAQSHRTCIIYVVVCWGVLQDDIVFPALGLDADVASRYYYLAVAGFPLTFALAWFFQITPEGIVPRRLWSAGCCPMAPINDRRSRGLSQYMNSAESEYDWILVAESSPLAGLSFGIDREVVLVGVSIAT